MNPLLKESAFLSYWESSIENEVEKKHPFAR